MSRVLLVNPAFEHGLSSRVTRYRPRQPLSLATMASMIRNQGHSVSLQDLNVTNSFETLDLTAFAYVIVSTAPIDRWETPNLNYGTALDVVRRCRQCGLTTIVTGPHGSLTPDLLFQQSPYLDVIVRGEPEMTALDLISGRDLDRIEGISYRQALTGEVKHNPDRSLIEDLDSLPFPAYDLLPMDEYALFDGDDSLLPKPFSIVETSRGCPFQCIFCLKVMHGKKYRARSPGRVIDELLILTKKYGVHSIYFQDLEFTLDAARVQAICEQMSEKDMRLRWGCASRVADVDKELLVVMEKAGCVFINFGVETLSQEILKKIKKGITPEQVVQTFRLCQEVGIAFRGFWIAGFPGENGSTLAESMKTASKYGIPHPPNRPLVIPYPGTELYEMAQEQGLAKGGTWEEVWQLRGRVGCSKPVRRTYTLRSLHYYFQLRFGDSYWFRRKYYQYLARKVAMAIAGR